DFLKLLKNPLIKKTTFPKLPHSSSGSGNLGRSASNQLPKSAVSVSGRGSDRFRSLCFSGLATSEGLQVLEGIIYDVIVEPPSVGSVTDEHGHQRPVAFLAYRVNGQYIMEGLASSFLFTMGGLGFIILDRSNAPNIPKLNRFLLLFIGFVCVLLSFFMARVFMRMKLPGYLMG
uniref:Oligosaccharyltransferase complex subunit n=1 Tax=Bos taurus TaxID=9913 RepID=A0AAA9RRI0_BOVIN